MEKLSTDSRIVEQLRPLSRKAIVRLSGGLGNQLFQLCAGMYAIRQFSGGHLFLDTRFLGTYEKQRQFEIGFVVKHLPCVSVGCPEYGFGAASSRFRLGRLLNGIRIGAYAWASSSAALRKLADKPKAHVVLDGYFQGLDFLFDAQAMSSLREKLFGASAELLAAFRSSKVPLVGIHIRRGDYVTSTVGSRVFETITLDYYRSAISKFGDSNRFLIFSDDPILARSFANEIRGRDAASLGLSLEDEFCLFAACDHYIIANSTFSWWASRLGCQPGKRVVSPRKWYRSKALNAANQLLLPCFELIG